MNHSFKRKEEKYILNENIAQDVIEFINTVMPISNYNNNGYIDIRTTYLESSDHYIYHLKKLKKKSRFKIRIREYGFDGLFKDYVWVELKEKVNGEGYKNRFKVNKSDVLDFMNGGNLIDNIILKNRKIDPEYLIHLYTTIQKLIAELNLKPLLVVQYKRIAFDTGLKGGVRFTFDKDIISAKVDFDCLFKPLENFKRYKSNKMIMELKTWGIYPELMVKLKKKFNIKRKKYSKFIFGMEANCFNFTHPPLSLEQEYNQIIFEV
ncbi:MAG: polyphosphate polymerase domain-containing protein [Spirochaetaceae bacterium]